MPVALRSPLLPPPPPLPPPSLPPPLPAVAANAAGAVSEEDLSYEGEILAETADKLRWMVQPEVKLFRVVEQIFEQRVGIMCVRARACLSSAYCNNACLQVACSLYVYGCVHCMCMNLNVCM